MRPLLVIGVLALAGCSAPPGGTDACTPVTCESLQPTCGTVGDGCGAALDCGACGDGGSDSDGGLCTAESHAAFCARYARVCGPVEGVDNCGSQRTGDCGACTFPDRCSDAGTCGCTPKSCAAAGRACGEAYVGCGQYRDCGPCDGGAAPPPHPLRVISANLSSGNLQSYDPGHGARILQGLSPDLVLIQEFHYGAKTDADARRFVDQTFGDFYFYREPRALPNGVISRYPIVSAGSWDDTSVSNRGFVWAQIDVPGPRDLWAISLHFLTSNASARNTQAQDLVAEIQGRVPTADYLVLGGDLNTGSRTEACMGTLATVVSTAAPHPADQANNSNTNATRSTPLDWVLADSDLRARQVPLLLGANSFTNGLVFDTRVYTPLADAAPALVGDSAASNMQHMAVCRQFSLP